MRLFYDEGKNEWTFLEHICLNQRGVRTTVEAINIVKSYRKTSDQICSEGAST